MLCAISLCAMSQVAACRFQYMTFASYIAQGVCPRTGGKEIESRKEEYKDLYHPRGAWNEYYRDSSRALNTGFATETCFCEEGKFRVPEYRIFRYSDQQVRQLFKMRKCVESWWHGPLLHVWDGDCCDRYGCCRAASSNSPSCSTKQRLLDLLSLICKQLCAPRDSLLPNMLQHHVCHVHACPHPRTA